MVSIVDFGAAVDGSTDDSFAVSSAIIAHRGVIFFPSGVTRLNSAILSNLSDFTLEGEGDGSSIIECNFSSGDVICIGNGTANPNNVHVKNLNFRSAVYKSDGAFVRFRNGHNCSIDKCRFDNNGSTPVILDGGPQCFRYTLSNFEINSGWVGVEIGASGACQDVFINNGIIASSQLCGILLKNGSGIYVSDVDIISCATSLATFPGSSESVKYVFLNAVFADTATENGFKFITNGGSVSDVNINHSWACTCGHNGILIDQGSGKVYDVQVSNSKIFNNQLRGIYHGSSKNISVSNCSVQSNSVSQNNGCPDVEIMSNVSYFSYIGNRFGANAMLYDQYPTLANRQTYSIDINSGSTDKYIISNNICPDGMRNLGIVAGNISADNLV